MDPNALGLKIVVSDIVTPMIRAIIFDCFGVFYADPVFAYMRNSQTPPEKAQALHSLDKQAARGALSKAGFARQAADLLECSIEEVERQFFVGSNRNDTLMAFAQQARKKYKIALLSNIGGDMMDGFFSEEERKALFDVVVLSGNVEMAKPDPEIFELTLQKLGVTADEVLFIDDSKNHIEGARRIGIRGIQYSSNEQLKRELLALGLDKELVGILQ